jgi:hypothetical protein
MHIFKQLEICLSNDEGRWPASKPGGTIVGVLIRSDGRPSPCRDGNADTGKDKDHDM